MSMETIIGLIGVAVVLLSNFVIFVVFLSRISSRLVHIEKDVSVLKKNDELHDTKFYELASLNAKMDLIIDHHIPKLTKCNIK